MDADTLYQLHVTVRCHRSAAPDTKLLIQAVQSALVLHRTPAAEISFVITDDIRIAEMNEAYLKHEGPTDVLTFDLCDDDTAGLEGEIVISADTARREAAARGHSPEAELALYAVHGVLHLLGYDDTTADAAARMHAVEDQILAGIGLPSTYHRS